MIILIPLAILMVSFVLFKVISKSIAGRKRREAEERARREECYAELLPNDVSEEIIFREKVESVAGIFKEHPEDTALLISKLMRAEPTEYGKKSAFFLVMIGASVALDIIKYFSDDENKNIFFEIARLETDSIGLYQKEAILREFQALLTAYQFIKTRGIDIASEFLEKSLGSQEAIDLINLLTRIMQG